MAKREKQKQASIKVTDRIDNEAVLLKIGEMCVAWAALEYVLFRLFYYMSGLPTPVARSIFYSQNTNRARINLLHATYTPLLTRSYKPMAGVKKIKKYLDSLANLANKRNDYIHDPWAWQDSAPKLAIQMGLKTKGSHGRLRVVRTKDVAALTKRIETAGKRAVKLTLRFSEQFETSRKRLLLDRDLTLLFGDQTLHVRRRPRTPPLQPPAFPR
jgi:hypothetical protein